MLKCRDIAQRASEYLDGTPSRSLSWQMRLHLAMCRNCRRFVRHLEHSRTLAAQVGQIRPTSPEQTRKIVQILRKQP